MNCEKRHDEPLFIKSHFSQNERKKTRQKRVATEIRKILAEIIPQFSNLPNMTVTAVDVSSCLQIAKVYVLPLGGNSAEGLLLLIGEHLSHIRRLVGERLDLRYVPELRFFIDDVPAHGARIEEILRNLPRSTEGSCS